MHGTNCTFTFLLQSHVLVTYITPRNPAHFRAFEINAF